MSGKFLLDTNITIALFGKDSSVLDRLQEAESVFVPSVVSHKSLDFGCHSERSEESRLFKYMRPFTSFRVTRKTFFSMLLM